MLRAIRMALVARRDRIARLILGSGAKLALFGGGIGVVSSFTVSRLVRFFLFGVSATDQLIYIESVFLMLLIAAIASALATARTAAADPIKQCDRFSDPSLIAAQLSLLEAGVVWILVQPGIVDVPQQSAPLVRALYLFAFMLDGPAYASSLGLCLAGLSVAGLMGRSLPRWLAWTGLVISALGELSFLSMLAPGFGMLIPMTRFPGYLWLILAGFILSAKRTRAAQA